MTKYVKATGKTPGSTVEGYPYSFRQLRDDNPQTSFPRPPNDVWLERHGVYAIDEVPSPGNSLTENAVEVDPVLVGDVWTQSWSMVPASADKIARRAEIEKNTTERQAIKADAFVANFIAMTPAQVTNYIDSNVTNLASAKSVIEKLALMVLLLARREFKS